MLDFLRELLSTPAREPTASVREFWTRHRARTAGLATIDRAIAGGFSADRLGYAFCAGYEAALRALVPSLPDEPLASLCATEAGGAHPRAIQTTLRAAPDGRFRLDGHKAFATLAQEDTVLLVVASTGADEAGRNQLRVARVTANAPGVTLSRLPETPFVPEIPHAEVALDDVRVAAGDVLPGDGYERYLKPFRTIEDLHVHAAVLAHVLGVANQLDGPAALRERLLFLLSGLRTLAREEAGSAPLHVALGGALSLARALIEETGELWARAAPEMRGRWERDQPLLRVAERARAQRLAKAWQRVKGLEPAAAGESLLAGGEPP